MYDFSPLSVTYEWRYDPCILRTTDESSFKFAKESVSLQPYDKMALTTLRNIGIMGTTQFVNLFYPGRIAKVKKLEKKGFLQKHRLLRDGAEMHVYTLGISSFHLFDLWGMLNYWVAYRTIDVLRKMIFFKVCEKFIAEGNKPNVYTGKLPCTGTIEMKSPLDVLIVKENTADIQSEWRYSPPDPNRHLVVVTENLNFLKPLQDILIKCIVVRVILEQELYDRNLTLASLFYRWTGEGWSK
ncbi:hypothetical protein [Paenibacillus sp. LjRoot153]|uniref:hypothetical protein n=1 Tax=Paenibacillus sp. LjRoot153 TaxID=3342270 RepID=UPI003F4FF7C1